MFLQETEHIRREFWLLGSCYVFQMSTHYLEAMRMRTWPKPGGSTWPFRGGQLDWSHASPVSAFNLQMDPRPVAFWQHFWGLGHVMQELCLQSLKLFKCKRQELRSNGLNWSVVEPWAFSILTTQRLGRMPPLSSPLFSTIHLGLHVLPRPRSLKL